MNILAVDTAGKTAGVALLQDDRLLYEVYLDAGMTHSETLMPMIDTCLKMCGMTCADIDLYGVNAGPGSFTGLRIGLAAVKGLAFPRETLCAPVSTLEALAAAHTGEGTVLCALDARLRCSCERRVQQGTAVLRHRRGHQHGSKQDQGHSCLLLL